MIRFNNDYNHAAHESIYEAMKADWQGRSGHIFFSGSNTGEFCGVCRSIESDPECRLSENRTYQLP